jgi:hypothetical protein
MKKTLISKPPRTSQTKHSQTVETTLKKDVKQKIPNLWVYIIVVPTNFNKILFKDNV